LGDNGTHAKIGGVIARARLRLESGAMLGRHRSEKQVDELEIMGRITTNPAIFGGKPIIRGMRISVELILSLMAQGETVESILADYPDLEAKDILACFAYARAVLANDRIDAIQVAQH
jgi:uncharacterized protein (DUF433 family)